MTLFSLLLALLIEQLRPLPSDGKVAQTIRRLSEKAVALYDDGSVASGRAAWCVVVLGSGLLALLLYYVLLEIHPVFAFAFNVALLYASLGFRHHGAMFAEVVYALSAGRLDEARARLGAWRGSNHDEAGHEEVARLAIERSLVTAHRSAYGVLFWFVLLPGPTGALVYRLAVHLAADWDKPRDAMSDEFGIFAQRALAVIDWAPVRVTAIACSIIGNFEDAMYAWRAQSMLWSDRASGILISSGAGALGVRLGLPVHEDGHVVDRPEMGMGNKAGVNCMQAAATLAWRVLAFYVLFVALLWIAGRVGG